MCVYVWCVGACVCISYSYILIYSFKGRIIVLWIRCNFSSFLISGNDSLPQYRNAETELKFEFISLPAMLLINGFTLFWLLLWELKHLLYLPTRVTIPENSALLEGLLPCHSMNEQCRRTEFSACSLSKKRSESTSPSVRMQTYSVR